MSAIPPIPPPGGYVGPITYRVGKKTYQIFYMIKSLNHGNVFPDNFIVAPCFGIYRLLISVTPSTRLLMNINNLSYGYNYFNDGNPLTEGSWYQFEFLAFPGMQFQFQVTDDTVVSAVLIFEGECYTKQQQQYLNVV